MLRSFSKERLKSQWIAIDFLTLKQLNLPSHIHNIIHFFGRWSILTWFFEILPIFCWRIGKKGFKILGIFEFSTILAIHKKTLKLINIPIDTIFIFNSTGEWRNKYTRIHFGKHISKPFEIGMHSGNLPRDPNSLLFIPCNSFDGKPQIRPFPQFINNPTIFLHNFLKSRYRNCIYFCILISILLWC